MPEHRYRRAEFVLRPVAYEFHRFPVNLLHVGIVEFFPKRRSGESVNERSAAFGERVDEFRRKVHVAFVHEEHVEFSVQFRSGHERVVRTDGDVLD